MSTLFFAALAFGLTVYTLLLAVAGTVRRVRAGRNPGIQPLKPIWRRRAGLPLLLWAVVVPIMGANLLDAVRWNRVFKSMAEVRSIAAAVERYAADHGAYPAVGSMDELARLLEGEYIEALPRTDRWGRPYRYYYRSVGEAGPQDYVIVCTGSDGLAEAGDPWDYPSGTTVDPDSDIVYSNGKFVRYPEGRCC